MIPSGASDFTAAPEGGAAALIDLACLVGEQLLIYGWVREFTGLVEHASIKAGSIVFDLTRKAIRVRRPDVARHFSIEPGNDEHGFYALIDLPESSGSIDHLRLSVTLRSGKTSESQWPVCNEPTAVSSMLLTYETTLNQLLPRLPRQEARRLVSFAAPGLRLQLVAEPQAMLPEPVRFEIDLCCVLEHRILVVFGWLSDPANELTLVQLRAGATVFDFLRNAEWIGRPDISPDPLLYRKSDAARLPGFMFVQAVPEADREVFEARFVVEAGADTVHFTRPVYSVAHEARREFLSLLTRMEPNSALILNERVASVLDDSPAQRSLYALLELNHHRTIERLPQSIQHSNPRYALHIDQAIPVADKGIFLFGWFNAEPGASVKIVCHRGRAHAEISDQWVRHVRNDVTSHLARSGVQVTDHEHGYSCYVPLGDGVEPYYLSVRTESGETQRMRVAVAEKAESAMQTVRTLLTSFESGHRHLRFLMDRQIGPAAGAAWVSRLRPARNPWVLSYGAAPTDPAVSIIVPLYGRHDFAEYQMALFADDPEFQGIELIYVVDDPAIFDEFRNVCPDLYGVYQVPFVVAFAGVNLGFAGANNLGASIARGHHLLLLNSDVMPKRPGWVGDLVRICKSLATPGLLGAKLLYEDGSVQHAGIAYRRYWPWGGLWINDHPSKGQSPVGLTGVREVEAVTAACAVIEAALYHGLGGLSEDYIVGDFEDSDLCQRAISAGRRNYVALDVELYHLERQSQNRVGDSLWRTNLTAYNCWLHNNRWGSVIERTRKDERSAAAGGD